jgi:uncharacterized protein (DUF983 family)
VVPFERAISRTALALDRAVRLRCPRCGEGRLFTTWFRMPVRCTFCGLPFERAQGYFVGAIYVNYGVTVVIAVVGYFVLWTTTGISTAGQLALWVPFVVLFPLWFFRYSRSLWLALEYLLNPEH